MNVALKILKERRPAYQNAVTGLEETIARNEADLREHVERCNAEISAWRGDLTQREADLADIDTAIAALETIPTPEEINQALDEIEAAEAAEAKLLDDEPEPSLFDAKDEPEPTSQQDDVVAYFISGDGPIEFRAYGPITQVVDEPALVDQDAQPEPTELDAPASIVDDPELQAAVARAEATLAKDEPAYVGLQDADLDAEWDAMKAREEAEKPKPRFSIFGRIKEDA